MAPHFQEDVDTSPPFSTPSTSVADVECAETLAVCGIALRLPGGISTPEEFWDLLVNKKDARSPVPITRYDADKFYSGAGKSGFIGSKHGYFLDESVDFGALDSTFFSMPRQAVERLDPQVRILLELVHECFESAGECNYRGRDIGCWVGAFAKDWIERFGKDSQAIGMYKVTGYGDFLMSNRISYEYDLKGPSMTIGTACSSSLVGFHEACRAIRSGDCNGAIVAGANLILGPTLTLDLSEEGVLSPNASCRTFDAGADGYARGEAVNVIYIKKLSDALRDGNPVRAIIRGTASNADGKTAGLTLPSADAQAALIRNAYADAGIHDFSQTGFFECHGTGTPIGDPIETSAVGSVFGESGMYIGSVKPNVGHSEGASGLTSVIKMILALEHQTIPPNIKFEQPNPKIPFAEKKLMVPVEPIAWPKDKRERASINSFGIGGANAHVVLDSPRGYIPQSSIVTPPLISGKDHSYSMLVYSANTTESLRNQTTNIRTYLDKNPQAVNDVSYTLSTHRMHLTHRSFSIRSNGNEVMSSSSTKTPKSVPEIAFIFTGQGAQYPRMGAELLETNETFAASIRRMDKILANVVDGPTWTIAEELAKYKDESKVYTPEFSQPLCTAVQMALVDVLNELSIRPYAVLGHSSGEVAAAYAAGKLTAAESIIAGFYRGMISERITSVGSMAAIGMGRLETEPFLTSGVCIACENSGSSVTISGDVNELDLVLEAIKAARPNILARRLNVNRAYHSSHMREAAWLYEASASPYLDVSPTQNCLFFSTTTGTQLHAKDKVNSEYWKTNLENPVLFHTAVKDLISYHQATSSKDLVLLEVGPHSALKGPLRQILTEISCPSPYTSCLIRGQHAVEAFLTSIGQLHVNGVVVDFEKLTNADGSAKVLRDLPTYPWHHEQSLLFETRLTKEWRFPKFKKHELLGARVAESTDDQPSWRNLFILDQVPWVKDHIVKGDVLMPCAGYVAMAGEAVRQLAGDGFLGFTLRGVTIGTAMVLTSSKNTEILTSLQRGKLTDSLDSDWFDFTINSYNGNAWVKHCFGQVRAQSHKPPNIRTVKQELPRSVDKRKWYQGAATLGGLHGPYFQGLRDIRCSPTVCEATANAFDTSIDEVEYAIHPTTIDVMFQMFAIANAHGLSRKIAAMNVPTWIDSIDVYKSTSTIDLEVRSERTPRGTLCGDGTGYSDSDDLVLHVAGIKLSALSNDDLDNEPDAHAGARTVWRPHIDFLDISETVRHNPDQTLMMPYLEALHIIYVQEAMRKLEGVSPSTPHFGKFLQWLAKQKNPKPSFELDQVVALLSSSIYQPFLAAMTAVLDNIEAIFKGEIEPLEVLLPNDTLTNLYNCLNISDRSEMIQFLGHLNPNMRVLEIGAGTGGTTNTFLLNLKSLTNGTPMFSEYTYTDVSAGFFATAQERFKGHANIVFKPLDISKDPLLQGFEPNSYDLIIAANVLHATPSLEQTLNNVRRLLHAEGRLYLEELCCDIKAINFVMGILPGWWLGEGEGRVDEPYVSPERWDKELRQAGFDGLSGVALDCEEPHQMVACLTSSPKVEKSPSTKVCLIHDELSRGIANELNLGLTVKGFTVSEKGLSGDSTTFDCDIITCVDLENPYLENMDQAAYASFQNLIQSAADSKVGILWLTRQSQMHCKDPRWAQIIGAARTIRGELDVDIATCEIDNPSSSDVWSLVHKVFAQFQRRKHGDALGPEYEYSISEGKVHVGRIYPVSVAQERALVNDADAVDEPALDLQIGTYGRLNTLKWIPRPDELLADNEVEIDTKAVGLNFKDVLIAMGIVDATTASLGLEAAGVVLKVGNAVKHLKVGDRAFVFGGGCFSTRLRINADLCRSIPDSLGFTDAATMPCVFSTVIHGLLDVGRLESGQSVLVHSACGGVGLAAIQICKTVGADIYATVGSEDKIDYLVRQHGISRQRIFNSRDASFLDDILEATSGRGVDLVLNSLSGELLHASWNCVAEFGKMIEIGKRDLIGHGKLALDVFELNRSYHGVDLGHLIESRPKAGGKLLDEIVKYYEAGHIKPINPTQAFEARAVEESFRYMQKGQHIGKIVVSMNNVAELSTDVAKNEVRFDSDASYLLVGGLGGLGREVSNWMVEQGARYLVFLSRTAGKTAADQAFFQELESQGCSAIPVRGSVTNIEDVNKAVTEAKLHGALKGVLNMSMVLHDQNFTRMTHDEWTDAVRPKVQGTWNLHNACSELELEFFILFSSISGVYGQRGQANYAGANTFLDAFVQYRHNLGLPAGSIDIGLMLDHGAVADNPQLLARLNAAGSYGIRVNQLLDCLEAILSTPLVNNSTPTAPAGENLFTENSQLVLGLRSLTSLSDPSNRQPWKDDRRMAIYHNDAKSSTTSSSKSSSGTKLTALTNEALGNPGVLSTKSVVETLADIIARQLFQLLLRPVKDDDTVDVSQSLADAGLDSLVAIEMRAWWKSSFGTDISVLEMLGMPSLLAMGEHAANSLLAKLEAQSIK